MQVWAGLFRDSAQLQTFHGSRRQLFRRGGPTPRAAPWILARPRPKPKGTPGTKAEPPFVSKKKSRAPDVISHFFMEGNVISRWLTRRWMDHTTAQHPTTGSGGDPGRPGTWLEPRQLCSVPICHPLHLRPPIQLQAHAQLLRPPVKINTSERASPHRRTQSPLPSPYTNKRY